MIVLFFDMIFFRGVLFFPFILVFVCLVGVGYISVMKSHASCDKHPDFKKLRCLVLVLTSKSP